MINPHKTIFNQKKKLKMSDYKLGKLSDVNPQLIKKYRIDSEYGITFNNVAKMCKVLGIELKVRHVELKAAM